MKKFLLSCIAMVSSFTAFAQTDVTPVVNKYSGDLYIALETEIYDEDAKMPATVTVAASAEDGKVDFSLPNFSFAGLPLGDIFLPNITLNQTDDAYTFGENPDVRFNFLAGTESEIVADAHLDNTRSYIKGDSIVAYIPVMWIISEAEGDTPAETTPIYVLFKGVVANTFALDNGDFDNSYSWMNYSKPWDSTHGYFNLALLDPEDDFWKATQYTSDDFITPSGWCIANVIGMNGLGATVVGKRNVLNDEETESAVTLTNTANPMMSTQIVPGYMTLGTSWATASVTNLDKSADGGAFGGVSFKGKPDAIQFDYMRAHEGESTEPATFVAYLWKGEYKQADVPGETAMGDPSKVTMYGRDRNILGLTTNQGGEVTKSDDAACVASVIKSIEGEKTDTFGTITVDLNYGEFAGTDVMPDSLNIIFAANDYFGDRTKMGVGNSLTVDNIKFIYYHGIKDVTIGDEAIEFDENNDAISASVYNADKFHFTRVGEGATVTQSYDGDTGVLTITVAAQDVKFRPEAVTTYTIHFALVPESINDAKADTTGKQVIYTIDGRRSNTLVKGINIVNGKKVVK